MKRLGVLALGLLGSVIFGGACGSSNRNNFVKGDGGAKIDGGFAIDDEAGTHSANPNTCEGAEAAKSYIGCDYWPTVLANNVWDIFDFAVVVANGQDDDAEITISGPMGASKKETVPAGGLKKIFLPWVKDLKGNEADSCGSATPLPGSMIAKESAYHLTSTIPVTVYQFSALEYKGEGGPKGKDWSACPGNDVCPSAGKPVGCFSFSNDASLLLPSSAWTGTYRVTGQKGLGDESQGVGSYFGVIAASDETTVTVKLPSLQASMPGSGITGTQALKFKLNTGDVAQIVAPPGDNHDLSGALVTADKPVQVIAGTPCSIGGQPIPGLVSCDHLEESVFPAETLGKHYVVAPPTSPGGAVIGHIVRFYGNADDTKLTYVPSRPPGCPASLKAGEVVECEGTVDAAFEVTGDHEFAVGSFMLSGYYQDPNGGDQRKGDPSQTLATAVEQYRTKYIFLAPDDYDENWVDIVVPDGTSVEVDGQTVTDKGKKVGEYLVVRHQLGAGKDGAHTLTASNPVGIQVMGFGAYTSYHYPGGLDLNRIAPTPVK